MKRTIALIAVFCALLLVMRSQDMEKRDVLELFEEIKSSELISNFLKSHPKSEIEGYIVGPLSGKLAMFKRQCGNVSINRFILFRFSDPASNESISVFLDAISGKVMCLRKKIRELPSVQFGVKFNESFYLKSGINRIPVCFYSTNETVKIHVALYVNHSPQEVYVSISPPLHTYKDFDTGLEVKENLHFVGEHPIFGRKDGYIEFSDGIYIKAHCISINVLLPPYTRLADESYIKFKVVAKFEVDEEIVDSLEKEHVVKLCQAI